MIKHPLCCISRQIILEMYDEGAITFDMVTELLGESEAIKYCENKDLEVTSEQL